MRFPFAGTRHRASCATVLVLAFAAHVAPAASQAQASPDTSHAAADTTRDGALHLTIHDVGIAIGNARHVDGIRLNYRDSGHYVVHGLNATVWSPYEHSDGLVKGIALRSEERRVGKECRSR